MIPREYVFTLGVLAIVINVQADLAYDSNDWVPITGSNNQDLEKQSIGRTLHVSTENQPSDVSVRSKKSNNDQFLREVSSSANRQAVQPQPLLNNFDPQLNQGEILNPFFKQPSFQPREELHNPQHVLFRQNSPAFPPPPVVFPGPKPQYMFRQPFPPMQPGNIFGHNLPGSPFGFQAPIVPNFNQSNSLQNLNPGIRTINQGLSPDTTSTNRDTFRKPIPEKPPTPADGVQLLYVPLDSLNQNSQGLQRHSSPESHQNMQFHILPQVQQSHIQQQQQQDLLFGHPQQNIQNLQFSNPAIDLHKQQQLYSIQNDFAQQALNALNLQLQLQEGHVPPPIHHHIPTTTTTTTTTTTSAPTTKKRKAHQPPLAVYMGGEGEVSVSDVLSLLKDAKSISVQDAVGPNTPQVFVGPQNLEAPEGYVKFDLPYLSSIENNRIERKVDQLPFFVAPVSYKAPPGYSKILLPAPHVGSVVVSHKDDQRDQHNIDSSTITDDSFKGFREHSQTVKFENNINDGVHRFNNQIQSSTETFPPKRIPSSRPALTQTINNFELEEINNQFVPQFPQPQFDYESNIHPNTHVEAPRFGPNVLPTFNRGRTQQQNYVTTLPPFTSTSATQTFVEIATTKKPPETNRFSVRPTQKQVQNHHNLFEEFPRATNKHSEEEPPVTVTTQPPTTILNNAEGNFDYHNRFVSFNRQSPLPNDGQKSIQPSEIFDDHLLDPAYQIHENSQFASGQGNHHTSHKLIQPAQEQQNKNLITPEPSFTQHLTEQSLHHSNLQNRFVSKEKPHFSSSEDAHNEDVSNYKLPSQLPSIHPEIHSLINELQDPSVRQLLIPAAIVPTSEPVSEKYLREHSSQQSDVSTELQYVEPTTIPYVTTTEASTTTRRQRGRQRSRATTTTYTPRRTAQRTRKPVLRTTTERIEHSSDPSDEYNYFPSKISRNNLRSNSYKEETNTEPAQRPTVRSRIRNRVRTTSQPLSTEQTTSVPFTLRNKQSQFFDYDGSRANPQSYMQFEHENVDSFQSTTEHQRMNVDVVINHPNSEKVNAEPTIISEPDGNTYFIRYNQKSEVPVHKVEETTPRPRVKIQSRGRFKTRTTTTPPFTSTSNSLTTAQKDDNDEFYGFFKPPNFNSPSQPYNPNYVSTTKRPVYISNTIQYEDQPLDHSNNVNVVSSTPSQYTTLTAEMVTPQPHIPKSTPRSRIRGRVRIPKNKSKEEQQPTTPVHESRLRSRGKTHFTVPDKVKDDNKDEEVEGGNYPKFFPRVESTTRTSKFQITIGPALDDEDQEPFSSIHRPKVIPVDDTVKSVLNDIPIDKKIIESEEQSAQFPDVSLLKENESNPDAFGAIMEDIVSEINKLKHNNENEELDSTTLTVTEAENNDSTPAANKSNGRRRGFWKLVKRPVDSFEVAESQYVGKVSPNNIPSNDNDHKLIEYHDVSTQKAVTDQRIPPISSSTNEPEFLETFYKMFQNSDANSTNTENKSVEQYSETTNAITEEAPITEQPNETTTTFFELKDSTTTEKSLDVRSTTNSLLDQTLQPTQTSATETWISVKTSTATEISHETEVCFRGKCVKSSEDGKILV